MCIHQLFHPKPFSPRSFSIFGAEGSWDLMHAHVSIFLADFFSFSHFDVNVVPCRLRLGLCSLDILFCLGLRSACGRSAPDYLLHFLKQCYTLRELFTDDF